MIFYWIEKDGLVAIIYQYDKNEDIKNEDALNTADDNKSHDNHNNASNNDKSFEQRIVSHVDISKDRDIKRDPTYGIELLRSLAVKSANPSDTDIVNSCITGLFSILTYISPSILQVVEIVLEIRLTGHD